MKDEKVNYSTVVYDQADQTAPLTAHIKDRSEKL